MLSNEKIRLELVQKSHLEKRVEWINNREISKTTSFEYPTSVDKTEKWFDSQLNSIQKKNFTIISNETDELIGMCGYLGIDYKNEKAEIYITLGEEQFQGKGFASMSYSLLIKYGFEVLNLNKIYLTVFDDNEKAKKMYRKLNFKEEGTLRENYKENGSFKDVNIMSLLKEEHFKNSQ